MIEETQSGEEIIFTSKSTNLGERQKFTQPRKTKNLVNTQIIRLPGTVVETYKRGTKKGQEYRKKIRKNEWILPNHSSFEIYYKQGHFNVNDLGETIVVSNTIPKVLPNELGNIILNVLTSQYENNINLRIFETTTEQEINTLWDKIQKNQMKNQKLTTENYTDLSIYIENYNEIIDYQYKFGIPCVREEKEGEIEKLSFKTIKNTDSSMSFSNFLNRMKGYYNTQGCYLAIDGLNLKKMFQILGLINEFVYPNTRGKVLKTNNESIKIKDMFNNWWVGKKGNRKGKLPYYLLSDLDNEIEKGSSGMFLEYFSKGKNKVKSSIEGNDILKQYAKRIITLNMVKKMYKNFYSPPEKTKKMLVRQYWQNFHPTQKNIDLLSDFYSYLSINLDLYITACNIRNILYKPNKQRIGKKKKDEMTEQEKQEIRKQKVKNEVNKINNEFLQGGRLTESITNLTSNIITYNLPIESENKKIMVKDINQSENEIDIEKNLNILNRKLIKLKEEIIKNDVSNNVFKEDRHLEYMRESEYLNRQIEIYNLMKKYLRENNISEYNIIDAERLLNFRKHQKEYNDKLFNPIYEY